MGNVCGQLRLDTFHATSSVSYTHLGREIAVKDLVEKAQILEALKEIKDRETLQRFCRYMEALVAYFKFYGGKD